MSSQLQSENRTFVLPFYDLVTSLNLSCDVLCLSYKQCDWLVAVILACGYTSTYYGDLVLVVPKGVRCLEVFGKNL